MWELRLEGQAGAMLGDAWQASLAPVEVCRTERRYHTCLDLKACVPPTLSGFPPLICPQTHGTILFSSTVFCRMAKPLPPPLTLPSVPARRLGA